MFLEIVFVSMTAFAPVQTFVIAITKSGFDIDIRLENLNLFFQTPSYFLPLNCTTKTEVRFDFV